MKANLPQREPDILKKWQDEDIYATIHKSCKGKKRYILHDGPPYANGDIHAGHALNKTLKDIVVKYKTMRGFDAPYVPGWDCHGLPVEHQLFRQMGKTKHEVEQVKFRKKAHAYAMKYVGIQRDEFKRLGIFGNWEDPYLTLDTKYEASIVNSLGALAKKGFIYRGHKPINWCIRCETALAEAEVEYAEHTSPSVYVKFECSPSLDSRFRGNDNAYLVIWTTTPWTLVSNVAVAVHPKLNYAFVKTNPLTPALSPKGRGGGEVLIIAEDLVKPTMEAAGITQYEISSTIKGAKLEGLVCKHPFIDRESVVVLADYVSKIEGTGCVHTAPGHGREDYMTGLKYKLPVIMPVDNKGRFDKTTGEFADMEVFLANDLILQRLKEGKFLLASDSITHSYPHCWRCKNPVITRATKQWFIDVDHQGLRKKVLEIIKKVSWTPKAGESRISAMVELRPDWCLSRQRYWGVPIPAFYCKGCQEVLFNEESISRFAKIVETEGTDSWFAKSATELLPAGAKCGKCGSTEFEKENDILDVWFDSGVSHQAVLVPRKDQEFPADLYLEGSDQHRGWFQTALLTSASLTGKAPFKQVLTHGFVVDGEGRKMSKSLGNVISPQDVIAKSGADVLRLWVMACDYEGDMRISEQILQRTKEAYRKLRNTFKFLLGNIYDFDPKCDKISYKDMAEIDKWALAKAYRLIDNTTRYYEGFEFYKIYRDVYNFCITDMSSIYLDILKDRLYTFKKTGIERRSAQTALYEILSILVRVLAPVLSFTCEEVWENMPHDAEKKSVHLAKWPVPDKKWKDEALIEKWKTVFAARDVVLKALEEKRAEKVIGNALEAQVALSIKDEKAFDALKPYEKELASVFIVSGAKLEKAGAAAKQKDAEANELQIAVSVSKASGKKCARCWNYSTTVGSDKKHAEICQRCVSAL